MIPVVFRTPRSLGALNVLAVGFAIASATTAAFTLADAHEAWPVIVGAPSLFVGLVWAMILRRRDTIGSTNIPLGWLLSVPLAALNGALACGLLMTLESGHDAGSFFGGMVLGATFGILLWAPGLLLVLLLFGAPLAHARHLAQRGLAGEERGERFVGLVCAALAISSAALAWVARGDTFASCAFAPAAVIAGLACAVVATKREAKRRKFVARVLAGEVPHVRVETRDVGKVLVRIDTTIETYRVAPNHDEDLFELDDEGRAIQPASAR